MSDTIVAISTPLGIGGIGVIRMSGDESKEICAKIFASATGKNIIGSLGYRCFYGYIIDNNQKLDDVIVSVFNAPHSYTGEDVVEISCHGGIYICKRVLELLLENGATPAMPGEFTKRAFLNNKFDLTRAEAVIDIINSSSERSVKLARQVYDGALFKKLSSVGNTLSSNIAHLEAWADYPDEDIDQVENSNLLTQLENARITLQNLLDNYENGKIIKDGINTVIIGKSNVGKSTLMNLLSGCERSIVTDIPGTTRDIVEEKIILGDYTINLCDTAGFRNTDDTVEKIGLERAKNKYSTADLIIAVFDYSSELSDFDYEIINDIQSTPTIAVINKVDLDKKLDCNYIENTFTNTIYISAKNDTNLDELHSALKQTFDLSNLDSSSLIMINERQRIAVKKSLDALNEAIETLSLGLTLDAVTVCMEEALSYILELTGEKVSDKVINDIFSTFCVGK